MNELQRQTYLSALGVDTYMPRWHLPAAPVSVACAIPAFVSDVQSSAKFAESAAESSIASVQPHSIQKSPVADLSVNSAAPIGNLIGDIFETKKIAKPVNKVTSAADILAQLETKPVTIEPFSLSIWRPLDGVMVVDSRNTKLALPTELFLNNILRTMFYGQPIKTQEEVLRWPMIENSFAKRTIADARNELQTWLSVQHEIRPIRYLWLMGENAATFLLADSATYNASLYSVTALAESSIQTVILPSLNELLQKPTAKQHVYSALRQYHSVI